jgi:hypothetical protein
MPGAHLAHPDQSKRIGWIGGTTHEIALDGSATDTRLAVLRTSFRAGAASPVHIHPDEDETLIVLPVRHGGDQVAVRALGLGARSHGLSSPKVATHLPDHLRHRRGAHHHHPLSGIERFFLSAGRDLSQGPVPDDWNVSMEALQNAAGESVQIILGPPLTATDTMPAQALDWASVSNG